MTEIPDYRPHYYTHEGVLIDTGSFDEDIKVWALERELYQRVAETQIDEWWVSTVFLGINHSMWPGVLEIFETMVFDQGKRHKVTIGNSEHEVDPEVDGLTRRYATWEQAEEGHREVVGQVRYLREVLAGAEQAAANEDVDG